MMEIRKNQYEYYKELILTSEIGKWDIKALSEIATDIYIGSEVKKDQLGTGTYPAIKCGDVNSGLPLHFYECISFVDPHLIKNKRYFEFGDILMGKIGNIDTSGRAVVYLGKEKCLLGDAVYALKHDQNPKFIGYILSTRYVRKQIKEFYKPGTVFNFFIRDAKKLKIPLPSLEEQEKIVSKLDKLNHKVSELEMYTNLLIQARNKQYNVYSGNMFNKNRRKS